MPIARKASTRAGEPAVEKKPPEPDDPDVADGLVELVAVPTAMELRGVSERCKTADVGLAMAPTSEDVGSSAVVLQT